MDADLPPEQDTERALILDKLARLTDHAPDKGHVRQQIEQFCSSISDQLRESRTAFDAVIYGMRRCATSLPVKAPVYATVLGLLTISSQSFGKELAKSVIGAMSKDLDSSLRAGASGPARRTLRFFACLSNCSVITVSSLADYIVALLKAAHYELAEAARSDSAVHCRGPFLADVGMSALPWAAANMNEHVPEKLAEAMNFVQLISEAYHGDKWRCVSPATTTQCAEIFSELIAAVSHLRTLGWVCADNIIPRPQDEFQIQLNSGQDLELPHLNIPSHSKLTRYSAPRFRVCLVNKKYGHSREFPADCKAKEQLKAIDDGHGLGLMRTDMEVDGTVTDLTATDITSSLANNGQNGLSNRSVAETGMGDAFVKGEHNTTTESKAAAREEALNRTPIPTSDGSSKKSDTLTGAIGITSNGASHQQHTNKTRLRAEGNPLEEIKPVPFRPDSIRSPLVNYILRCYVGDVVDNFADKHMIAAERLLNVPMFKNVNDEIVDGVFSHMCSLPHPSFTPLYYGTLFVDLCRVKDSRLPAKLLTAVESMFQEAAEFDPEVFDRLTDWFSFHLSNFGYKWNWADWAIYADEEVVEKFPYRALFCKDVLGRCVRLSYYERIMKIIPAGMKYFLPPAPGSGDRSRFDEAINGELMKVVTGRDKKDPGFVENLLRSLIPTDPESRTSEQVQKGEEAAALARLAALIRSILQAGCKTLSHFDIVSERYEGLLRDLSKAAGHPGRRLVTLEVTIFWKDVHIRLMYVLDKLRARAIIDSQAIIDSCLAFERVDENGLGQPLSEKVIIKNLSESTTWELIRMVFSRATSREEAARDDLEKASQAAASANEGETEKVESLLQQAKANTEKAKNDIAELLLVALRRLFGLCSRLLSSVDTNEKGALLTENGIRLPGLGGKPIWYWRCTGMIRELARRHSRHLLKIMNQLDVDTKDNREHHKELQDSFDIIKEVEGSAMLPKVS